ncbi:sigma-70 family RNA polymerase sigma factor [Caloramator australicus]|uniref:RpoS-like sigma factor n=1 Tax=Caloramator australicus RC3 TaxID=857293 RepID=I7K662_9CLOT|nr:sigma-70 family RNA polymerase sigma factor [Caloramator australicus]CCJ33049.1 RpoS-like sigma factor [Caloramator australicus RC3]
MTNEELFELYSKGNTNVKEQLIINNLNLVKCAAKRYFVIYNVRDYKDIDYYDLVQAGSIGLMKAIDKFNPSLGWKFSSYAYKVISTEIRRVLDRHEDTLSLDENIGDDDDDTTLMDVIEDKSINFVEELELKELKKLWDILAQKLNEKEIKFLKLKHINNLTEKQICRILEIPEEKARQFSESVLRKARSKAKLLRILFDDYLDKRTSYLSAVDYSIPKVREGYYYGSIVESIVLERERLRERFGINLKTNFNG